MNQFVSKYYLKLYTCLLSILLLSTSNMFAQISSGGKPLKIDDAVLAESAFNTKVSMPKLAYKQMAQQTTNAPLYKVLKFGHAFDVSITPNNSGRIYYTKYFKIWQIEIESEGAYAINLIFDQYHLPKGARLFVSNADGSATLGAFTSKNNKETNQLALHPLPGDKLKIQYEEPLNAEFKGEISIGTVVHAYLDIFNEKNLFDPRRTSGDCHIDVQCETESNLEQQKRATCRVFAVDQLGTATLVNNTRNDGTPYILSAYHVFDNLRTSNTSVFSFNYESPFCTGIDGSDYLSISGASVVAGRPETDMILLELSETPPPSFRPYFVGWDSQNNLPENTYCIHHPNGDTKKISHDTGICKISRFHEETLPNGHWKVVNWESGSTEFGSSGSGLFSKDGYLLGTLSGGKASCSNIDYDVFARFDVMYNYYSNTDSQLKYWLNPDNQNIKTLTGYDPYSEEQSNCTTISNFTNYDQLQSESITATFISNNKQLPISEIASSFNDLSKGILTGVSIGIESKKAYSLNPKIQLNVYSEQLTSDHLVYTQEIKFEDLNQDAFNYIELEEELSIEGKFYVSFELLNSKDSINFYFSNMILNEENTLFFKVNDVWEASNKFSENKESAHLLIEVNVCSFQPYNVLPAFTNQKLAKLSPNPASDKLKINFTSQGEHQINIYNASGYCVFRKKDIAQHETNIDVSNYQRGIYFIQVQNKTGLQNIKLLKK